MTLTTTNARNGSGGDGGDDDSVANINLTAIQLVNYMCHRKRLPFADNKTNK